MSATKKLRGDDKWGRENVVCTEHTKVEAGWCYCTYTCMYILFLLNKDEGRELRDAAQRGDVSEVTRLIESGASINSPSRVSM